MSSATADPQAAEFETTQGPPPRTITAELEQLFQELSDVASLPAIARQVLMVASKEDACAADLLEVIEQDPALAMKVLKTVNSSYYGLRNEVADLRTGISLLGVKQVRNLALTIVVGRQFAAPSNVGTIDPGQLWDHSICTAVAARHLAERTKKADPDEAYLAGLIHDAGLLVIDQELEDEIPRILVRFKSNKSWMDAEQDVLSFDHAQLGAYIAWRSGFPHKLVAAVDYHHQPGEAPDDVAPLASVVAVANYLVSRLGRAVMAERRLPPPLQATFDRLEVGRSEVRSLWTDLETLLESAGALRTL